MLNIKHTTGRVREKGMSPPYPSGKTHADILTVVGRSHQQPNILQRYFGHRAFQSWLCLAGIPNQSCHCPCFPLDYDAVRGVFSRPLPQSGVVKNSPRQMSVVLTEAWY